MKKYIKISSYKPLSATIILMVMILVSFSFVVAIQSLGTYQQNTEVELPQIANSTYCNITKIIYPNSTKLNLVFPLEMTKVGLSFNYSLNKIYTSELGQYIVEGECDTTAWVYDFDITYNGREDPSEFVIVFFSIGFLIVIGFLAYMFLYNLGHFAQLDYDLGDLIKNVSAYFVLVGLYLLSSFYLGNEMIDGILVWIMGIAGFTNVAMSFLAMIICLILQKRKMKENAW